MSPKTLTLKISSSLIACKLSGYVPFSDGEFYRTMFCAMRKVSAVLIIGKRSLSLNKFSSMNLTKDEDDNKGDVTIPYISHQRERKYTNSERCR